MRADMYRILRGKTIYISFAVMLAILVVSIFVLRTAMHSGVIIIVGEPEYIAAINEERFRAAEVMSGSVAAQMMLASMETIAYFFIPLVIIVAMAAFSSGAIKNEIPVGINRTKFYLSKLVLASILCIAFVVLYPLLAVVFATTVDGVGDWSGGLLSDMLNILGSLTVVSIAFSSVGVFLCFATKRAGAVIGLFLAVMLIPSAIVALLYQAFPGAMEFLNYDLFNQFYLLSQETVSTTELVRGLAIALAYIIGTTVAGLALFKKAEI